jgi:hypothetical protein
MSELHIIIDETIEYLIDKILLSSSTMDESLDNPHNSEQ